MSKTRNSCKTCGASGTVIHVNATGTMRHRAPCPQRCHPDKYIPNGIYRKEQKELKKQGNAK